MKLARAFMAGVVAGVVLSVMMAIGRAFGVQMNISMFIGTMIGLQPGPVTWLIGFILAQFINGLLALPFAAGFEYVAHRADWIVGTAFGGILTVFAGIFMAYAPQMHPLIPEQMPAPGPYLANQGMAGIAAFIVMHLVFGAVIGALYGPVGHSAPGIEGVPGSAHTGESTSGAAVRVRRNS